MSTVPGTDVPTGPVASPARANTRRDAGAGVKPATGATPGPSRFERIVQAVWHRAERRGFTPEQVRMIHRAYRILFAPGFSRQEALELIGKDLPDAPERRAIVDFVTGSARGIIRGPKLHGTGED